MRPVLVNSTLASLLPPHRFAIPLQLRCLPLLRSAALCSSSLKKLSISASDSKTTSKTSYFSLLLWIYPPCFSHTYQLSLKKLFVFDIIITSEHLQYGYASRVVSCRIKYMMLVENLIQVFNRWYCTIFVESCLLVLSCVYSMLACTSFYRIAVKANWNTWMSVS